ncbi:MAG: 7TM domain-containing protein, partial [Actinomycetota bacterium]
LGSAAVLASRTFLGLKTIGTFAPALLALTILQMGPRSAAAALLVTLGAAMLCSPILDRMALPRPSRLAALTVVVLASLTGSGVIDESTSAAPVVVLAIVMERTWDTVQSATVGGAIRLFASTVGLAFVVAAGLERLSPSLAAMGWASSATVGLGAILVVSQYRGLRLSELVRFRPVLAQAGR